MSPIVPITIQFCYRRARKAADKEDNRYTKVCLLPSEILFMEGKDTENKMIWNKCKHIIKMLSANGLRKPNEDRTITLKKNWRHSFQMNSL